MNKVNTMKKTIISLAIPAIFAFGSSAFAQNSSDSSNKPTVTSSLSSKQVEVIQSYADKNKEIDLLNHRERVLETESKILKLQLDKAKSELEIDMLLNPKKYEDPVAQAPAYISTNEGKGGKGKSSSSEPESSLNDIYVTKIYGMDNRLSATVYYKGSILDLNAGDEIDDGIKLVKIVKGGAIFSDGKKTKRVSMTTSYNAYVKSFPKDDDDDDNDGFNPMMPIPMMPMNPMSPTGQ